MKNYIANGKPKKKRILYPYCGSEQGHWDTSKALVRRTLEKCILIGRQNRVSGKKQDEYEAFRLLGQAVRRKFFPLPPNSKYV